jgi:cysteine desulfurase/selenocysteine lyase
MHPEFPQSDDIIYLNHAAVSPWPLRTARAVQEFAEQNLRQGARAYPQWLHTERALRAQLQRLVNAPSIDDIALLKNTSEALSVIAHGLSWQRGDNVVLCTQEFPSNRIVWESLHEFGVECRIVPVTARSEDPEAALLSAVNAQTRLLAVSSVQYASGLRMDLQRLGDFCHDQGVLFCVDAIQSLGALPFDAQAVHADFVVADGHKWLLGPEGLAVFYCRAELRPQLRLRQFGWHMVEHHDDFDRLDWAPAHSARRFECGSPNMLGIHALHASLSLIEEIGINSLATNIIKNSRLLIDIISNYDLLEVLTPTLPERHAGIVSFRSRQVEARRIHQALMAQGVICAQRGDGVRFSAHFYADAAQLERAVTLAAAVS